MVKRIRGVAWSEVYWTTAGGGVASRGGRIGSTGTDVNMWVGGGNPKP